MIKKHPYRYAIVQVRKLHSVEKRSEKISPTCSECKVPYPCKTIKLLDNDSIKENLAIKQEHRCFYCQSSYVEVLDLVSHIKDIHRDYNVYS
jgi:hypothetical protein